MPLFRVLSRQWIWKDFCVRIYESNETRSLKLVRCTCIFKFSSTKLCVYCQAHSKFKYYTQVLKYIKFFFFIDALDWSYAQAGSMHLQLNSWHKGNKIKNLFEWIKFKFSLHYKFYLLYPAFWVQTIIENIMFVLIWPTLRFLRICQVFPPKNNILLNKCPHASILASNNF